MMKLDLLDLTLATFFVLFTTVPTRAQTGTVTAFTKLTGGANVPAINSQATGEAVEHCFHRCACLGGCPGMLFGACSGRGQRMYDLLKFIQP